MAFARMREAVSADDQDRHQAEKHVSDIHKSSQKGETWTFKRFRSCALPPFSLDHFSALVIFRGVVAV